jgi:cytochrome c oxidase subunit III
MTTARMENIEEARPHLAMNPKKFVLWLFIVSIVMIFAALTSAYIVRQAEGNWRLFEIPSLFLYSTIVLIASSVTMQWTVVNAQKDELGKIKLGVLVTLVLGLSFLLMQYLAWGALVDMNVHFSFANPSESFLYVLTGLHAFHLLTGLIFIIIVLISSFQDRVHSKSITQLEMCATYWHFLDGLWLYLYIFLLINR